jgi:hypothetical protein
LFVVFVAFVALLFVAVDAAFAPVVAPDLVEPLPGITTEAVFPLLVDPVPEAVAPEPVPELVEPVFDETVASPKGRSSCAARAELLEGLTYDAPAEVLTVFEVVELLLTVFPAVVEPVVVDPVVTELLVVDLVLETPVLVETVGPPNGRSSCAARRGLLEGLRYVAPTEVLIVFEVVDLLLVVFPALIELVLDDAVPVD